jgi:hypothetical protein
VLTPSAVHSPFGEANQCPSVEVVAPVGLPKATFGLFPAPVGDEKDHAKLDGAPFCAVMVKLLLPPSCMDCALLTVTVGGGVDGTREIGGACQPTREI